MVSGGMAAMAEFTRHNSNAYGGHCGSCRTACRIGYDFLPGDAVGFSGADFVSDVITWRISAFPAAESATSRSSLRTACTASAWPNPRLLPPCPPDRGEQVKGVQFQHLRERIDSYSGKVWHYPLRDPLDWPEQLS
jgi:hypothetical protein